MSPGPGAGSIDDAVAAIRAGKAVVLPTDTVYGLVADGSQERPVLDLYGLKRRPRSMPLSLMAADIEAILDAIPELRGRTATTVRALLPGPFTLVLPNPALRFRWLCGGTPEAIGIRVPELPAESRAVLARAGVVASTSANLHGVADPRRLDELAGEIRDSVGAIIDGGTLPGTPSTVVDLTGGDPRVVREGVVPAAQALERAQAALA